MNIKFHPEIIDQQRFSCNCCARCCRSFIVAVYPHERQEIQALRNWPSELRVDRLFVRSRSAGRLGYGLAKRADGGCVFLDSDNLCLIQKQHGPEAKPLACRLYPFVLTPFAGSLGVGLRFDCPAVCTNQGQTLPSYRRELKQLAKQLALEKLENIKPAQICPQQTVSTDWLDTINETILKIINSNAMRLSQRLLWLSGFVGHLARVKWKNVTDDDFPELISMFYRGLLVEIQQKKYQQTAPTEKARKFLGQIFFLLSQPSAPDLGRREGLFTKLHQRLTQARALKQLAKTDGPLPKIQPDWPDCDLNQLEKNFGPWPDQVEQVLTRYLTCRIADFGYCGYNFYNYSLTEGIQTLLLALITIGWLMRINAVIANREQIELADVHKAVATIDGNLGYSKPLGFGPARLRLNYLQEYIPAFIEKYCT